MPSVRILRNPAVIAAVAAMLGAPVSADGGKPPETQKPRIAEKAPVEKAAEKPVDADASQYCANVAPSIAEARIAWQTKRLTELDGQIQQRIGELEKAEAAAREWIAKRSELMSAARGDLVAIYAKMEPESAARQLSALDDRTAAAIIGKLKPSAAGAILGEMDADRASRLAGLLSGMSPDEKKS
jgi:flagellar motility protein MotE (MotC chaperone)